VRELPAGTFVSLLHVGPYDAISAVYEVLTAWLGTHGLAMAEPPPRGLPERAGDAAGADQDDRRAPRREAGRAGRSERIAAPGGLAWTRAGRATRDARQV